MRPMNAAPIYLVLISRDRRLPAAAENLAACARAIAALAPAPIRALVAGKNPAAAAGETARHLGMPVLALEIVGLTDPGDGATGISLADFLNSEIPAWILMEDTTLGRRLAAELAVRLSAACITGVEAVEQDDHGVVLTRAVWGGKFRAAVRTAAETITVTVADGAFAGRFEKAGGQAKVQHRRSEAARGGRRHLKRIQAPEADTGLSEARAIVAAGSGIGEPDRLVLVRKLAERIAGAQVAGSRPVCDRGWLPYSRQVGITGATVAPALYIACGISGAAQHIAGMSGAGLVVAINKDPRAAIFQHADIGVVEDLGTFLPLLVEACGQEEDSTP
ncbi:MAG TPA: electron transfer flavoprotein subunit alpha/FixB family protein [Desulfobacteraceae bacterium]|nr:electron transfer flavoprotein subunit alpha/FixB family protein [Desulfobacteraceae bacterium]